MGFQILAALFLIMLITAPILAWVFLKRISSTDSLHSSTEELRSLENSLSLMIKEVQESVQKALDDMDKAADKLNQMIEAADDRLRQFEYYYEYGDELKPIVQIQQNDTSPSQVTQEQVSRHKEVHELSRKGWGLTQIARHTGMSTDEIQLIINLMEINTAVNQVQSQE